MDNYDAIVIGAGQGGSPLAHKLADMGQKVALIEELGWAAPASTTAARRRRR